MRQIIIFLTSVYDDIDLGAMNAKGGRSINSKSVSRAIAYLLELVVPNLSEIPEFNAKEMQSLFAALGYPFIIRADAITAVGAPSSIAFLMKAIFWLYLVTKHYFYDRNQLKSLRISEAVEDEDRLSSDYEAVKSARKSVVNSKDSHAEFWFSILSRLNFGNTPSYFTEKTNNHILKKLQKRGNLPQWLKGDSTNDLELDPLIMVLLVEYQELFFTVDQEDFDAFFDSQIMPVIAKEAEEADGKI